MCRPDLSKDGRIQNKMRITFLVFVLLVDSRIWRCFVTGRRASFESHRKPVVGNNAMVWGATDCVAG